MNRSLYLLPTAVCAALALAACSPRDNTKVSPKVDEAVTGVKSGMDSAKSATKDVANSVTSAATDATITAKVNVALAADDRLKAIKIDVDTSNGRVVLTGTAPDSGSRERATTLARAVEGVVNVDNRLAVEGKS